MKRVCKPNGMIVLITDNAGYWRFYTLSRLHEGGYKGRARADKHYCLFTLDHIKNHFQEAGLILVSLSYVNMVDDGTYPTKKIDRLLNLITFFHHMSMPRIKAEGIKT